MSKKQLDQILKNGNAKIRNQTSVSTADLECGTGHEPVSKKQTGSFNSRVSIHVHSRRKKLTDSDGACAKYVIDGLVHAGILADDSPEEVEKVSYSQEKTKGPEETVLTIEVI